MNPSLIVTKEFLEESLGRRIKFFTIFPGSKFGDNYNSGLLSIVVRVYSDNDNNKDVIHLLAKCFPTKGIIQERLQKSNMFWRELSIYKFLIPQLQEFCVNVEPNMRLPFASFLGGKAVNYQAMREMGDFCCENKVFNPFDNYILMEDMRATSGFQMAEGIKGLDLYHVSHIMKSLAILHATSWAYKKQKEFKSFDEEYPFLNPGVAARDRKHWVGVMEKCVVISADVLEKITSKDSPIAIGTRKLAAYAEAFFGGGNHAHLEENLAAAHRIKSKDEAIDEVPWRVLLHGDAWIKNILFRYDEGSNKPLEAVFVDLPLMREHCPTLDISYIISTATTALFRKTHINDILSLYHEEFIGCCKRFSVSPPKGFSFLELKRRYHRSKVFAYFRATLTLPLTLLDTNKNCNFVHDNPLQMFTNLLGNKYEISVQYNDRLLGLANELYIEGVI